MEVMGLKALGLILIVPALAVQGLADGECRSVSYKVELGTVGGEWRRCSYEGGSWVSEGDRGLDGGKDRVRGSDRQARRTRLCGPESKELQAETWTPEEGAGHFLTQSSVPLCT